MSVYVIDGKDLAALAVDVLDQASALRFRARGTSMSPFIQDGDILLVRPIQHPQYGDVVLCRAGSRVLVHRVIQVSDNTRKAVWLQGDSRPCPDGLVLWEDVIGQVVAVERGGQRIALDTGLHRVLGLVWVGLSPLSRWAYGLWQFCICNLIAIHRLRS